MRESSDTALAFKAATGPFFGTLTFIRVHSGDMRTLQCSSKPPPVVLLLRLGPPLFACTFSRRPSAPPVWGSWGPARSPPWPAASSRKSRSKDAAKRTILPSLARDHEVPLSPRTRNSRLFAEPHIDSKHCQAFKRTGQLALSSVLLQRKKEESAIYLTDALHHGKQ